MKCNYLLSRHSSILVSVTFFCSWHPTRLCNYQSENKMKQQLCVCFTVFDLLQGSMSRHGVELSFYTKKAEALEHDDSLFCVVFLRSPQTPLGFLPGTLINCQLLNCT